MSIVTLTNRVYMLRSVLKCVHAITSTMRVGEKTRHSLVQGESQRSEYVFFDVVSTGTEKGGGKFMHAESSMQERSVLTRELDFTAVWTADMHMQGRL